MYRKTIGFKTLILKHTINVICTFIVYNVILVYSDESFINDKNQVT